MSEDQPQEWEQLEQQQQREQGPPQRNAAEPISEYPEVDFVFQMLGAERRARLVKSGAGLHLHWPRIDSIVGPLMPGMLVAVGGRGKQGKSTFLRNVFDAWVTDGESVLLVGTEQSEIEMRMLWACMELGIPPAAMNEREHQDRIVADIRERQQKLMQRARIVVPPTLDLASLTACVRWAKRRSYKAVIVDHFSRMEFGNGPRWQAAADMIRRIKRLAMWQEIAIIVGAQLTRAEGPFGLYEQPDESSWAHTVELHREADISLVVWRPLIAQPSADDLRQARVDKGSRMNLVARDTMCVACVGHRYFQHPLHDTALKLRVERGVIRSWI